MVKINFSIVTVVYNNVSCIKNTMNSVIKQNYKNIEYIVVDGGSADGTKEAIIEYIFSCANIIVKETNTKRFYLEAIHKDYPALTFKFLSEKDKGIYDAMNKGITLATKDWINFMNCGDLFYDVDTLSQITKKNIEKYDVIYGDTLFTENETTFILSPKHHKHKYHHNFVHQSTFVKTEITKKYPFDASFKIAGDALFFTRLYNLHYNFHYIPIPISIFCNNGISSSLTWLKFYEDCRVGYQYNRFFPIYLLMLYTCYAIPRRFFKKLILKLRSK